MLCFLTHFTSLQPHCATAKQGRVILVYFIIIIIIIIYILLLSKYNSFVYIIYLKYFFRLALHINLILANVNF